MENNNIPLPPEVSDHTKQGGINEKRKNKKPVSIKNIFSRIIIGLILAIIVLFVGIIVYFRVPVSKFYSISDKTFKIPDLGKDFVPQGIFYDGPSGDFYVCGYMSDDSASPIYIIDKETGKVEKKVLMAYEDGSPYSGHASGIALYNGRVYIAGCEDNMLYYDPSKIRETENGNPVNASGIVELSKDGDYIMADLVTVKDDNLLVGEFYRVPNYITNKTHEVSTNDGKQYAYAVAFKINDKDEAIPQEAFSIRGKVQGICVKEDTMYISESYGLAFSHIYGYDLSNANKVDDRCVLGAKIPFYIVDSASQLFDLKIPPMSEEIDMVSDKLYVMSEAASNKYKFGKITGAKKCYAINIYELK